MAMITKTIAALLVVYGAIVFAMWLGQRRLMYVPDATRTAPAAMGLADVTEALVETPDGARIVTWQARARDGQPTLLYFHGNGGNLAGRANRYQRYRARGFGLMAMSYRSYSGSTGSPTEANNLADARLVYHHLIQSGVKPAEIVVYGKSLGSGVAVQIAAEKAVAAVVLDAPYTSAMDVAARAYPFLPVRPLLADRYESNRYIGSVRVPVLVLHGERDTVIPVGLGRALHAMANEPKRLVIYPDGGHTNLDDFGAVDAVTGWLADIKVTRAR